MTERIAHRELRNQSAAVLRAVAAGSSYEITNHGSVVALLTPVSESTELRMRPPRVKGPITGLPKYECGESTADILADLRGER